MQFDYWTDPLCVWAFVAQRRLEEILAAHPRLRVRHRVVPVFGSVPWRFREGAWAVPGPEGRAAATRRIGEGCGWTLTGRVWLDDPPASSWSAGAAVVAAFDLAEEGTIPLAQAEAFQWELRRAFFVENLNTARRAVQLSVAEAVDLPRTPLVARLDDGRAIASLWEHHREREANHIQGSPTWVFDGGRAMLYGNVSHQVLAATVEQLEQESEPGCSIC